MENKERKGPRIRLIANPAAGRAGEKKLSRIIKCLESAGASVEVRMTRKRGDAREAALIAAMDDPRPDMVVAAGGDGTINEVVNGVAGTKLPVGVIPLGTVNLFALETGIPFDIEGACDVLLNGIVKEVNAGTVNGRYFMLMAGIGFDADVVYRLDLDLKKRLGRTAYVLTGLTRLAGYRFNRLKVELDGERTVHAYSVVIGNMKYYGGRISITPFADFEKDTLDVCIFKNGGIINMLRYTAGVMMKRHLAYRDVEYVTVRRLKVSSERKTYIQADGDTFGALPAEFSKVKKTVTVIIPRANWGDAGKELEEKWRRSWIGYTGSTHS